MGRWQYRIQGHHESPQVWMTGEGAKGEVLSVAFAGENQFQDTGAKMVHGTTYLVQRRFEVRCPCWRSCRTAVCAGQQECQALDVEY